MHPNICAERDGRHVDLATVLRAMSEELMAMGRMAEQVQTTLSPIFMKAGLDSASRKDAQACDQLTQRLYGVSAFVAALEPSVSRSWTVDPSAAGRSVLLSDLAQRLSCIAAGPREHAEGELELF